MKVADTLVADYDVVDLLHTLLKESVRLLDAFAAGLLLADPAGELQLLASTSDESQVVEIFQLQAGAGPCGDCYTLGTLVTINDLAASGDRWPDFAAAALSQGFRSVHAIPMRVRTRTIAALNLFRSDAGELTAEDAAVGQALADVATISILQERTIQENAIVNEQLQRALTSRILIEQAKAVIAQTSKVEMPEAFSRLRAYARSHHYTLHQTAEGVINRSLTL